MTTYARTRSDALPESSSYVDTGCPEVEGCEGARGCPLIACIEDLKAEHPQWRKILQGETMKAEARRMAAAGKTTVEIAAHLGRSLRQVQRMVYQG